MSAYINPKIMTWARERNGLTVEEVARRIKKTAEEVRRWESGKSKISYSLLEKLAYSHFKIPLAIFYFPEPPDLDDPKKSFRRLPDYELERLSPGTLQTIRLGQAYQESLVELSRESSAERQIFKDLRLSVRQTKEIASQARRYIAVGISRQFEFQSAEVAFKAWRRALENVGIYTFKASLKDKFISGFSLQHSTYPIIFINNSNAHARQVFTLFHELGHILFGVNGITDVDERYIQFMSRSERLLEIKCNEFAAEVLVPQDSFRNEIPLFRTTNLDVLVPRLARKYAVSREVILRKSLETGLVGADYYEDITAKWNKDFLRGAERRTGGNFYLTRLAYLGEGFTRLAFRSYYDGKLSQFELASHLNVNARNLARLEDYLGR